MTVAEEAPQLKDEEVLPLMHTLQLEQRSSTCSTRLPLVQRLRSVLNGFTPELLAIALVYFVQGILKLSSLAVTFFLKDNLAMEPTQMALAETITHIPWTIKPLYGFITDSFPICGMRRRPYLILAGLLGTGAWLCMAVLARSVPAAIAFITIASLSTAFSDVVADSIVVQLARAAPGEAEGGLQSMCWTAHAFGRVITAYLSGWLVGHVGPRRVFVATATFPLIVCASSCLIHEGPRRSTGQDEGCDGGSDEPSEGLLDSPQAQRQREQQALLGAAAGDRGSSVPGSGRSSCDSGSMVGAEPVGASELPYQPLYEVPGHRRRSSALSGYGSMELLMSQLQLSQGYLMPKQQQQLLPAQAGQVCSPRHGYSAVSAFAAADGASLSMAAAAAGGRQQLEELPGDDVGSCCGSEGSNGSGKHKHRGWCGQVCANMSTSVKLFWDAVKQPHMLRPLVFLFLMQAMPHPHSAMFFFKTNKLGFDAEFFGRVKLVAALADLIGLAVYNAFLKGVRLRPLLLWGSLLGCAVGLTPLLLVEGINRQLGISDRLFAMVDSALLASIGQVLMLPILVLCARLCPEGVEATLYASLMSLNNAAHGVASLLGALMTGLFGITSTSFTHLSVLLLTCNLMSLLPLPLVGWVPDERPKDAAAAAAAAVDIESQGSVDGEISIEVGKVGKEVRV